MNSLLTEFICYGGGRVKVNLLRIGKSGAKIFYCLKSSNYKPNKNKGSKNVSCYKYEKRPNTGITNLLKIFVTCFGHEICLKALSMENSQLSTTAIYMQLIIKDDFPCNFF